MFNHYTDRRETTAKWPKMPAVIKQRDKEVKFLTTVMTRADDLAQRRDTKLIKRRSGKRFSVY